MVLRRSRVLPILKASKPALHLNSNMLLLRNLHRRRGMRLSKLPRDGRFGIGSWFNKLLGNSLGTELGVSLGLAALLLSASANSTNNASAATPEQWLMEMGSNASRLNYSGSLVYTEGRRMQSMRIYHSVKNGVRRERLVHLSGEPREVIRRGDTVLCIDKVNGEVELKSASGVSAVAGSGDFTSHYAARFAALSEPYQVIFAGQGRVAGRDVILIDLLPKDQYRHGFKLALDNESKLLLRSLMVDEAGQVLERFEYTQIGIGQDIADEDLEPQLKVAGKPRPASAAGETAQRQPLAWKVGWVPPAFMQSQPVASAGGGDIDPGAQMFSDGLTAFSVFVDEQSAMGQHTEQRGATTAHTIVANDALGRFSVTVVGEIPRRAAKRIAASVSRQP